MATAAFAQSGSTYSITSSTIDSGGGQSTSATYVVTGTAGQHDALDPSGSTYTVRGGFWTPAPSGSFTVPNPLGPDPSGIDKNRFVTFASPSTGSSETAVRVTLTTLYDEAVCPPRDGTLPDLSAFETEVRWLGPPVAYSDDTVPAGPDFLAAPLQCDPHFRDWSDTGLAVDFPGADTSVVHAFGAEVFPCSTYDLEVVDLSCPDLENAGCYSTALPRSTVQWGDVTEPYANVNFSDISAIVQCFKGIELAGGQNKTRCMLRDNVPPASSAVNFADIGRAVNAFKSIPYGELGPTACP